MKPKTPKQTSEFGKGLTYCLALFLCHSERDYYQRGEKTNFNYSLWFNASGDHLFDLEIPKTLPINLQKRLSEFRDKVLTWRISLKEKVTKEDFEWSIKEAKELIRLIDEYYGIKTIKGEYQ